MSISFETRRYKNETEIIGSLSISRRNHNKGHIIILIFDLTVQHDAVLGGAVSMDNKY